MFNFVSSHKGAFLHFAAKKHKEDLVRYLVDKGAPINFTDDHEVIMEGRERKWDVELGKINRMLELYNFENVNKPKLLAQLENL